MSDTVLVTYGTRYGSTREVAERIAATLREGGLEVDVEPARTVSSLDRYRAVVLGAPFFVGFWHKDARKFLERHQEALRRRPVAVFALGPIEAALEEAQLQEARAQIDGALEKFAWLKPAAVEMFVGKYDPAVLRGLDKLVAKPKASPLHGVGAHDDRDWAAIKRWAAALRFADAPAHDEHA